MSNADWCLILHAHLPHIPPMPEPCLEENWLLEAVHECYIPLLQMLDEMESGTALTFTLTPTLCAMLSDKTYQRRIAARLQKLNELAEQECERYAVHAASASLLKVAEHYRQHFAAARNYFTQINGDLLAGFNRHYQLGRIEIIASAATHAVLPLLADEMSIKRQIEYGIAAHRQYFQQSPCGFWLPECAYFPRLGKFLRAAGIEYTILASHAFLYATPRPERAVYAPALTPEGLRVFGRDPESSAQVWSAQLGYPADGAYREFYRDLGWDGEFDDLRDYFYVPEIRHDLGFKYHRVTGSVSLAHKAIYAPEIAAATARTHAADFLQRRQAQAARLQKLFNAPPVIVSPYDAELFGHWWYEGGQFLAHVLRGAAAAGITPRLPRELLTRATDVITPAISTWGQGGYLQTWLNGENDWLYPRLFAAQKIFNEIEATPCTSAADEKRRAQMRAELFAAQASDWAFIMTTRTSPAYARRRVLEHLANFQRIYAQLRNLAYYA